MLMRAEAEVELAGDVKTGETLTDEQTRHYRNAFSSVIAVWKRGNNKRTSSDTLVYADYATSRIAMEDLVLDERQRELMFEGKRWFDLLRVALRTGDLNSLAKTVTKKQTTNISGIQIRLANPNALFLPYYRNELKVNPYLKQNPAYNTGDDADLSKN